MSMEYQMMEDSELAQRIRSGEYQAFSELDRRYRRLIRQKAGQFSGISQSEKEDLVQEGFVGLFAAAKTFRSDKNTSFQTYAGVCIGNHLISAVRKYMAQKNAALNTSLPLTLSEETGDAPAAQDGNPQTVVEQKESFRLFDQQIREKLTELEYHAMMLHVSGVRRVQIPKEAGISLKAYDNALHRVRRKLKNLSDKHSA